MANVTTTVSAATAADQKAAAQDFPYYDEINYNDSTYTCGADDINLIGGDNAEKIYNYFLGQGLSNIQAAAIVGNISVESASTFDPEIVQGGGRESDPSKVSSGWGLIQWTPGSKIIGLLKQADIGGQPNSLLVQLQLIWWHMTTISPTGVDNMYADFQKITDISQATDFFEKKVEGAGTPHTEVRIERAKAALRQYGGGNTDTSGGTSSDSSCSSGGVASGEGTAETGALTFPLITTKAVIQDGSTLSGKGCNSGTPGCLKWCTQSTKNCHHDYNAADIMVPTGVQVIAAKAGTVQHVNTGNEKPNNITITNADGVNYYTHMGVNTVKLRVGEKVKAGDKLGKVGDSVDAMNTATHLHFDMLPNSYSYRPACSSAACSGYPFINVQAALAKLYNSLPEK